MATAADKKLNYVSRVLARVNALLDDVAALEALTLEGQALGYVAPPGGDPPGSLADGDFLDPASGKPSAVGYLNAAQFASVMATLQALDGQLHQGGGQTLQALFLARG